MSEQDQEIIRQVQQDGRASHAEIGKRVGLSTSAVNARLARMKETGVILRYTVEIDPKAIGLDVLAFVLVLIEKPAHEEKFRRKVAEMPEIQECHHVTGEFSYLLKMRASNTAAFEALVLELKKLPGLARTHTMIALSSSKETASLPVPMTG